MRERCDGRDHLHTPHPHDLIIVCVCGGGGVDAEERILFIISTVTLLRKGQF